MNQQEQTSAFCNDLDKLVDRYAKEFDLTYASVIGCLQLKIFEICQQAYDEDDD